MRRLRQDPFGPERTSLKAAFPEVYSTILGFRSVADLRVGTKRQGLATKCLIT